MRAAPVAVLIMGSVGVEHVAALGYCGTAWHGISTTLWHRVLLCMSEWSRESTVLCRTDTADTENMYQRVADWNEHEQA